MENDFTLKCIGNNCYGEDTENDFIIKNALKIILL